MSVSVDAVLFLLLLWSATRWDRRAPVRGVLPLRLVALLPLLAGIARVDCCPETLECHTMAPEQGDEALRLAVTKM